MRSTMTVAWVRWGFVAASSAILMTGCRGGSGGSGSSGVSGFFSSLFGGGDSGIVSGLSGFGGGSGDGGSNGSNPGPLADLPLDSLSEDVSTVSNPEPASLALFGSGLAGAAWIKRRKAHKKSQRTPA